MTRITEFKHFQKNSRELVSGTTICEEYPAPYAKGVNNPYYVVESEESRALHNAYLERAKKFPNLTVMGRLGEFRYYDMDMVVDRALVKSASLCSGNKTVVSSI